MTWPTHKLMAVDTETTGLDVYLPSVVATLVSWWDHKDKGDCFRPKKIPEWFRKRLASKHWTKLFFNAKFDIPILLKLGLKIAGPVIDVQVMCQMAFPKEHPSEKHSLKGLSRRLLKDLYLEEIKIKAWAKKHKKGIGEAPDRLLFPYAIKDARRTIDLYFYTKAWFDKYQQWGVLKNEMFNTRVMQRMEQTGMLLDMDEVQNQTIRLKKRAQKIKARLCRLTGNPTFNPNSTKQVAAAVYDGSFLPTRRAPKTGKPQVNKLALIDQPSKVGAAILKYRGVTKAVKTYLVNFIDKADPNNVIHANLNQNGARTGRISCSDPNFTNLPRPSEDSLGHIRECVVARPGFRLVFIDFEQLEIRIQAHFTREPHVLEDIRAGRDLHSQTCRRIFEREEDDPEWSKWRYLAKKLNLAMQYGMGVQKFCDIVLQDSDGSVRLKLVEAKKYIDDYKAVHPNLVKLFDDVATEVATTGGVTNDYGRFMPVDRRAPYKGVNYKIQGTAADLMKKAMRRIHRFLKGYKSEMLMQVHDELIFEIHHTEKHLVSRLASMMINRTRFAVPLTVSVEWARNWGQKKKMPAHEWIPF